MSYELLERFIVEYIKAQTMPEVLFCWHGGETLLQPLEFYRKVVELQRKHGRGMRIYNTLQTNGTLLDDDWCRFFKENGWIIGVSVDGPERFHDRCRTDRCGNPSFSKVMRGIALLQKHEVEWNALAVVNAFNADYPLEFYNFFKEIGCRHLQFTPVVERLCPHPDGRTLAMASDRTPAPLADFSVTPAQWGNFLCSIFDEWIRCDVGTMFVQIFESTLANWMGMPPGVCTLARTCGHAGAMEFNGDVYSCDHFVAPEYKLGNIRTNTMVELMYSPAQLEFGRNKMRSLPRQCRECRFLFACHGECPRNRFAVTADGEEGLNYLCEGYYRFFSHSAPYMELMKRELGGN